MTQSPMERLSENFEGIENNLNPSKRLAFKTYLLKTLKFGLEHGLENLYVFSFDNEDPPFVHERGTGAEIEPSAELHNKINGCNPKSQRLTMIHNHPNSFAPSSLEYLSFIDYSAVENMAVCGHTGNLYFVQKSEEVLGYSRESRSLLYYTVKDIIFEVAQIGVLALNGEEKTSKSKSEQEQLSDFEQSLLFSRLCEEAVRTGLLCIRKD